MDDVISINNTSVYRNPAAQSPLQGPNVMQPAAVYSKIMLRTIELKEKDFAFDGIAVERNMPSNNGANEIVFKRMLSLAAHTQPLVEGIPPASDKGAMVAIKGKTNSYGRVMKFTDKVNWAVVDPLISEYTRQLALKVPETKDLLAQEALLAEAQCFYAQPKTVFSGASDPDTLVVDTTAPAVTHITKLTPACNPTLDEFRKIVLSEESFKVEPYANGNFLALVTGAVMFDLVTDRRVKEYMKWTNTAKAYDNSVVIDMFHLAFKEAKTAKSDNTFIDADGLVTYLYHVVNGNIHATTGGLSAAYTGALNFICHKPAAELASGDKITVVYLEKVSGSVPANKELTIDSTLASATASKIKELVNSTSGLGITADSYDELNVHHSYIIGDEALFRIGIEGHSAPQFIKKELGSAGTEDPLNQRQSIGWKIDAIGYKVANPDAVVDYMSIPSEYRVNMNARPDLKNQFTDYYYGYVDASGNYYHPEQVVQQSVWDSTNSVNVLKYFVRGTSTEVTAVKMSGLVKPVNAGRIDANGKKDKVIGDIPSMQYALASNKAVRFAKDQVVLHTDSKYYIKGLAGTSSAEVVAVPVAYSATVVKSDGSGTESRTVIVEDADANKTGDPRIDD